MTEFLRKGAHVAVGGFAFLFGVLPPEWCLGLAIFALVHNAFLLPLYGRMLWRESDHRRGASPGILAYSTTLVLLAVVYFRRPDFAAAAWGILALGDGLSSPVGRALGGPRLPWNRAKSWSGFAAFAIAGTAAAAILLAFVRSRTGGLDAVPFGVGAIREALPLAAAAALAGAIAESLPLALDDNVTAPLAGAAVLALLDAIDVDAARASLPEILHRAPLAFAMSAGFALLAWRAGAASRGGAAVGGVIAFVAGSCGGVACFAAIAAFVVVGSTATRIGAAKKRALHIAEANDGRRVARHAFAKLGVPAILATISWATTAPERWRFAAIAALAAAAFDTVASEVGPLFAAAPRSPWTGRRVPPGTPGAISLAGCGAGGIAAALVIAAAHLAVPIPARSWGIALLAACVASLAESGAGARLVPTGLAGRSTLNFLLTAFAAWLAFSAG